MELEKDDLFLMFIKCTIMRCYDLITASHVYYSCYTFFYYYFFNRKLHLHYLHDLRTLLVIFLIIVNICEISQSCLSLHPPDDARYRITSPLSLYSACLYLISTVTVTAFIRIIEVRNKPGKFIIC